MNFPSYGNPDLGKDYSAISKVLVFRTVADDGSGRLDSPDSIIDDAALVARLATTVKDTPQLSPTIEVTYSPPYLFVGVDHSGEVVDAWLTDQGLWVLYQAEVIRTKAGYTVKRVRTHPMRATVPEHDTRPHTYTFGVSAAQVIGALIDELN